MEGPFWHRSPRAAKTGREPGELTRPARLFRLAHAVFAVVQVASLAHIWTSAVTRRRDRALGLAVGLLCVEGAALVVGRGNCPLGPFQRRLGDPVPLFELVLPPRAAKAAIPVLAAITGAGLAALAARPPGAGPR